MSSVRLLLKWDMEKIRFFIVKRKVLALAVCLVALFPDAVAQETGDAFVGRQPRYGFGQLTMHAISPEALRDSLAFSAHARFIAPSAEALPVWRAADSMAVPTVDYRNLSVIAPASAMPAFGRNPYAFDFSTGGVITAWGGGALVGSAFRTTMPALMSRQGASVGAVQSVDNLTVTGSFSADRYLLWRGTRTYFSVSGSATYRFSDRWSATVFGRYTANPEFYSMAAMPYMGTSGYGGFVTFMGERVGMDLGVERYYDTFAHRWVTSPIITPKIRFNEKFTLELPVGPLVKEMIDNAVHNRRKRGGPMIMPEGLPSVGDIPFGTPEIPR